VHKQLGEIARDPVRIAASTDDDGNLLNRERQQRHQLRKHIVPADWLKACDQCHAERWPWPVGSLALRNWYPPDHPAYGCTHPRQRAHGHLDYRYVRAPSR
jgi:hypothetical protein